MCAADAHAELEISILDETPLGQPKFGKPTADEVSFGPRQVELRLGRDCPGAPYVDPNACAGRRGEPINSSREQSQATESNQ